MSNIVDINKHREPPDKWKENARILLKVIESQSNTILILLETTGISYIKRNELRKEVLESLETVKHIRELMDDEV